MNLLQDYYQLNQEKKRVEKELKVLKARIIEMIQQSDSKVIRYQGYYAALKHMSRSILDQDAIKDILGAQRFESFKRVTEFDQLNVDKEA